MHSSLRLLLPVAVLTFIQPVSAALYSINPEADAFVRAAVPDGNYGKGGLLNVSGPEATNTTGSANGAFGAFLRFAAATTRTQLDTDFGPGQWRISAASLQFTEVTSPGNAIFNAGAGEFQVQWINGDAWEEGIGMPNAPGEVGITWNTRPVFLNAAIDRTLGTFFANPFTAAAITCSLTMDDTFLADLMTDAQTSFYLTAVTESTGFNFRSRDFANDPSARPKLLLTVEPIPEPCAAALWVLPLLALLQRRRFHQPIMRSFLLLSLLTVILPAPPAIAGDTPAVDNPPAKPAAKPPITLRVAVVNGLARRGPWSALATAFGAAGAAQVETLAGQREDVTSHLREGRADVALMHKGTEADALVKDGVAKASIPWAASGFVIAGPKADPAGVRGAKDAVEALQRILAKSAPLVGPDGQGTRAMFEQTLAKTKIKLLPEWKALDAGDDALEAAAAANAYFFAPAQRESLDAAAKRGMEIFISADPALRLEFVALISAKSTNTAAANALLKFLTDRQTEPHFRKPPGTEGRWMDLHPLSPGKAE